MDRVPEDGKKGPRIDVRTLPDSIARLWETMLRLEPQWDLSKWLDERATEELELVEVHLGRERLRLEQRLHRIEALVRKLKRKREIAQGTSWTDPHQRNLFDVYEPATQVKSGESQQPEEVVPLVDLGALGTEDDPLLTIVSEHIMSIIEEAGAADAEIHFDEISDALEPLGIRVDEIDEALAWLLQRRMVIELGQDIFGIGG
ncbi:MAG: hypothetical protein VX571_03960 [Candidatus Thermoplasmatota archaeon]|nr:hypothetical protein [Candidatus Thermoplasmatota archaeon]|tara:strand:- start:383 stop:991 length:609 start_codon:yes stop_codon:yes gene_type:complete